MWIFVIEGLFVLGLWFFFRDKNQERSVLYYLERSEAYVQLGDAIQKPKNADTWKEFREKLSEEVSVFVTEVREAKDLNALRRLSIEADKIYIECVVASETITTIGLSSSLYDSTFRLFDNYVQAHAELVKKSLFFVLSDELKVLAMSFMIDVADSRDWSKITNRLSKVAAKISAQLVPVAFFWVHFKLRLVFLILRKTNRALHPLRRWIFSAVRFQVILFAAAVLVAYVNPFLTYSGFLFVDSQAPIAIAMTKTITFTVQILLINDLVLFLLICLQTLLSIISPSVFLAIGALFLVAIRKAFAAFLRFIRFNAQLLDWREMNIFQKTATVMRDWGARPAQARRIADLNRLVTLTLITQIGALVFVAIGVWNAVIGVSPFETRMVNWDIDRLLCCGVFVASFLHFYRKEIVRDPIQSQISAPQ